MTRGITGRGHRLLAAICCLGLAVSLVQTSSATMLVRYTFDEPSGDAIDTGAAPGADGMLINNATRTTHTPGGYATQALDLISGAASGAGNYLDAGNVPKIGGLSQLTLTTWLNLQTDEGGNDRLLSTQNEGPLYEGFAFNLNNPNTGDRAAGNFRLYLFLGAEKGFVYAPSDVDTGADNEWKFLAVTYDGTQTENNLKYYVGGVGTPVTQLGSTQTADGGALLASPANFALGHLSWLPTTELAPPGYMDDARVYDEVLDLAALNGVRLENVPEPATMALLGLAGAALIRRKRT